MVGYNSYAGGRAFTVRSRTAIRCLGQPGFARQAGVGWTDAGIGWTDAGVAEDLGVGWTDIAEDLGVYQLSGQNQHQKWLY